MVIHGENDVASRALALLRTATIGTKYEGKLYLVGGALRDRYLHASHGADLDLVLEGDAVDLARVLFDKGLSSHYPVLYPRFGTAMIHLLVGDSGVDVELVTARSESYQPDSRKPDVRPGTLKEDIYRRDFTINTLAENLHTGEILDVTGRAYQDLDSGLIRTPVEPRITFFDDPLRMLRAIRLAARFQFRIEEATWAGIQAEAARLRPPTIAFERIRDEFVKTAMLHGTQFRSGMELLWESGLLAEFLPEMLSIVARSQQHSKPDDVWHLTLQTLEALPDDAPLEVRLALLWHDIDKASDPSTSGADTTRNIMNRLKFANDQIHTVVELSRNHTRLAEYRPDWNDPAIKRLIRETHTFLDQLFTLTECILSATQVQEIQGPTLSELRARVDSMISAVNIESPLDGNEIMAILGIGPGRHLKDAKDYLLNAVIDERLREDDLKAAKEMLLTWWHGEGGRIYRR